MAWRSVRGRVKVPKIEFKDVLLHPVHGKGALVILVGPWCWEMKTSKVSLQFLQNKHHTVYIHIYIYIILNLLVYIMEIPIIFRNLGGIYIYNPQNSESGFLEVIPFDKVSFSQITTSNEDLKRLKITHGMLVSTFHPLHQVSCTAGDATPTGVNRLDPPAVIRIRYPSKECGSSLFAICSSCSPTMCFKCTDAKKSCRDTPLWPPV